MEQDQYVKVNIKEGVRAKLKEQARTKGMTLADYIEFLSGQVTRDLAAEADALLEELDRQREEEAANPISTITSSIDSDELPECCQKIYSGRKTDRCEHWTIKNNRWYNLVTNRYIDDPAYTNYFQNA